MNRGKEKQKRKKSVAFEVRGLPAVSLSLKEA